MAKPVSRRATMQSAMPQEWVVLPARKDPTATLLLEKAQAGEQELVEEPESVLVVLQLPCASIGSGAYVA